LAKNKKKAIVPLPRKRSKGKDSEGDKLRSLLSGLFVDTETKSLPGTLMLVEVDDFEGFKQVFGAERCRRMLKEVAFLIQRSLRTSDKVVFLGQCQFGLLLNRTSAEEAYEVGERVRISVKKAVFAPEHGHSLKISVSCGFVTQGEQSPFNSADDLVEAALISLRDAQAAGQDRVVGYRLPSSTDSKEID
jgi:diguanylate cyclase (GGDEF)-like protein